jgi:hypothetical protein
MDRRAGSGVVITERDLGILRSVAECRTLTSEQIRRHHKFGSVGRTNATLLRLVRHRCLKRQFQPTNVGTRRAVYVLDRLGAQLSGSSQPIATRSASESFLYHQLFLNDIRFVFQDAEIANYRFAGWTTEETLRRKELGLVPDAMVEYHWGEAPYSAFIEADRATEGAKRFTEKVSAYLTLAFSGKFARIFDRRFFRVLVVAPDVRRVEFLRRVIARNTNKIFWLTSASELRRAGPLAQIWRRPASDALHSLTEP